MAKKSKEIDKHIEDTFDFKKECLRRNPEFISDVTKCWQMIKQDYLNSFEIKRDFVKKYGFLPPREEHLDDPALWEGSKYCNIVSIISPDKDVQKEFLNGKNPSEVIRKKVELSLLLDKDPPHPFLKNIHFLLGTKPLKSLPLLLEDERFLTVRIDTDRDEEIINRIFAEELKKIKQMKKEYKIGVKRDNTPHLDKAQRYFRVFDLRNKKPPTSYKHIAMTLIKEGYYKGKVLDRAENLAKKNYGVIFKEIYGMPYKEYDKSKLNKSDFRTCEGCPKYHECKEPCAELDYAVASVEVKQKHRLSSEGDRYN